MSKPSMARGLESSMQRTCWLRPMQAPIATSELVNCTKSKNRRYTVKMVTLIKEDAITVFIEDSDFKTNYERIERDKNNDGGDMENCL